MEFDPHTAAQAAKAELVLRKTKHYRQRRSKLEPYRYEIVKLYTAKYSLEVIQTHLLMTHYQKAHRSTILRYLKSIGVTQNG